MHRLAIVQVQRNRQSSARRDARDVGRLALVIVEPGGAVLLIDGPALENFGVSVASIGRPARVVFERFPELVAAIDSAMNGQRSAITLLTSDQSFEVSVETRREGGAIVAAMDFTAQRRRREVEAVRNREFALIFSEVPGAVWSTNRELVVTRAFGRGAHQLALDAKTVVNRSIYEVLGQRDAEDVLARAHRAALDGTRTSYRYTFRGRHFGVITEPLRDCDRRIVGTISAAVDVTTLIDAEERLATSQSLLADAQRVAHVGSWEWEFAKNTLNWSDEMYAIHGQDRASFTASVESFLEHVITEDVAHTREVVFGAFKRPGPIVFDHRIARPDGSIRMLHTRGDVIVDDGGKSLRMLGTCWDITDRWEASRALEHSASLLRATLDATNDGILVVDAKDQRITAHNQRFLDLWSIPTQLMLDGDDSALRAYVIDQLEDPTGFLRLVNELSVNPEREAFDVLRFRDGRVFERTARPQRLGGEVVGRVWIFRDVTERERAFRRAVFLSDSARLLSSLDAEEALSSVAHLAVPYLGCSCTIDLLGEGAPRRLRAMATDCTVVAPELSPSAVAGRSSIYSASNVSHMAIPLTVHGRVEGVITLAAAPGRRYTASDLEVGSELAVRIALALEKSQLLRRARQALRAREEFLAIAAHEIRGPVTSMHAAVQALLRRKLPEAATTRALALIEREDRRLARFVDELLDLGRTRFELAAFEREEISLARVVRDVVSRHEDDLVRSGSALSLDLDEQAIGMWNRSRLEKIVATLLTNATKFGLGRPIEITLRVQDGSAVLRVVDHGIGIEPEAQERIFAPFERAVSVRHYGGLGLGLFIASSTVKAFDGTIALESQPGVGSSFIVKLPMGGRAQ